MSWSYGPSDVLLSAVNELVYRGVFVTSSAGNSGSDDCSVAPRVVRGVLVVGELHHRRPARPELLHRPVRGPLRPWHGHRRDRVRRRTASYTGTSMAAPHAAGVAALYKQTYGDAPSDVVEQWIVDHATPGVVDGGGTGGTQNLLLNTGGL